jgi:hypothetical protein
MHFVPDTWLHRLLNNCGRFIPARVNEFTFGLLSHLYTQVLQRRIVRRLVSEHQIDVVQEPTPVSATFPSLMFGLGAPVAMGPLNTAVKSHIPHPQLAHRRIEGGKSESSETIMSRNTQLSRSLSITQ